MVLDNPFRRSFLQNHLAEDVFPEKKRAASGQTQTEPTGGGRVRVGGWSRGVVTGERTEFRIV